jgi:hypothetical protein
MFYFKERCHYTVEEHIEIIRVTSNVDQLNLLCENLNFESQENLDNSVYDFNVFLNSIMAPFFEVKQTLFVLEFSDTLRTKNSTCKLAWSEYSLKLEIINLWT